MRYKVKENKLPFITRNIPSNKHDMIFVNNKICQSIFLMSNGMDEFTLSVAHIGGHYLYPCMISINSNYSNFSE